MTNAKYYLLVLFFVISQILSYGKVVSYDWPTDKGQALNSDKYAAKISISDKTKTVPVLMSNAMWEADYRANELKGRTFSFLNISSNGDEAITFTIKKLFGEPAKSVSVSPRRYKIKSSLSADGRIATFTVDRNAKYFSVHFSSVDNETANHKWIKHMMAVFIDPLESDVPDKKAQEVVVYRPSIDRETLSKANIIYFEPGYYNLKNYKQAKIGSIIEPDGTIILKSNKSIYLAGGAFVEGLIERVGYHDTKQKLYGRGILSGRQYVWHRHPQHTGENYRQIVHMGTDAHVTGVMIMESPCHGIVARKTWIRNLKFLGWHCNNDGVRVNEGSEISHSFIRGVDDQFYDFGIYAHDLVIWQGHNGSIITYGWGGGPAGARDHKTYKSGGSRLENIDIIHPEWRSLGNNNGIVMSQTGYDYKPHAPTTLKNIIVEGHIPGFINLKPRSSNGGEPSAILVEADKLGYLGDLTMENIVIDGQFGKGRIWGSLKASKDGKHGYFVKNIIFKNVTIGGKALTEQSAPDFIHMRKESIKDLKFISE